MCTHEKIFIAGHNGMVGSAIFRFLESQSDNHELITRDRESLDLLDQRAVGDFFEKIRPTQIYIAAAKVGGIYANDTFPAEFLFDNLSIQNNLIHSAFKFGTKKILFLGSSCIYPKFASQPIKEEYLLSGMLEETNESYAIAKIAGIKLCQAYNKQYGKSHGIDYRSIMPCNLYGIGDNYHEMNSHVIPALIRKIHHAKATSSKHIEIWGTGKPLREFLYVDDLAQACYFVMNALKSSKHEEQILSNHINVGYGDEISISNLAQIIAKEIGFSGEIIFNPAFPDGTPRKILNSDRIRSLGWKPSTSLKNGIKLAYNDFLKQIKA